MTNAIVKHEPKAIQPSNVVEGLWIELKDKQPDGWTYNEINDHIKYSGSNSPVIGAREMAEDRANGERIARRKARSGIAPILIWSGIFVMLLSCVSLGVTYDWTSVLGRVLFFFALGTWIFFSGAGRMAG